QRQRTHRQVAVIEEITLPRDHRLRDPLDREEALFEVADQPAGLLQMLREQRRLPIPGLAEIIGILLIDTDARVDGRVDADGPALLFLAHDHIGHDRPRLESADLGAWPWIQA